ncbi:response regulator [Candidatus Dojkabacteria bacterium]|nr:response regulator [Candidatus Dojkabacteria bacterium]
MAKILIVEDESGIAQAFRKQLTLIGGFEVEIAGGGKEALEKLANKGVYDLVLLDLVMPEVDGLAVLRELGADKGKYGEVPVIILTNVTSDVTMQEALKLGAKEYIVKTDVDPDALITKINAVIGGKNQGQ